MQICQVLLGKKVLKFIRQIAQKFFIRALEGAKTARNNQVRAAQRPRLTSALVAIFKRGFPYAFAVLGPPSQVPTGGLEVLGGSLCGSLGLGVLDFVEVHFCIPLSFICLYYSTRYAVCQVFF